MKQKGLKNLIYGLLSQGIILAIGLVLPRLFIVNYGSEVNGLLTSVKQIFAYMVLLEAGVGAATVQALYAPVGRCDRKSISEILAATSRYYKKTGILYAGLVLVMAALYTFVIRTEISRAVVFFVVILQGAAGVIKYLFQGKYTLLMQVDGINYILSNLTLIITVLADAAQIVLILLGCNIVAVKLAYFLLNLLQMGYIYLYVKKHYDWIDLHSQPDYKALEQKNSALVHSVSELIFNNTDTILLTVFCGLQTVSVYAVYALVYGLLASVLGTISGSVNFALGQIFHTDARKFARAQDAYETVYLAITFALLTAIFIFIIPFIKLYTQSVTDIAYVDPWLPVLFTVINALNYGRASSNQVIIFAGHFKSTRGRTIIEAGINLAVSLVGVYFLGIYGVLLGTVVALLYRSNDIIIYANRRILNRSPLKTYLRWGVNILLMGAIALGSSCLDLGIHSYLSLLAWAVPAAVVLLGLFLGAALLCNREAACTLRDLLRSGRKGR